jgi:osomolarity two-component system, sensor histidine kinase SLN1
LTLTASLKAAQVNSDLQLLQSTCGTIVTRILIQSALQRFYQGNTSDSNWVRAISDIQSALASGGYSSLLQVIVYPRNETGDIYGLLNITGTNIEPIALPYNYSNGTVSS